MTSLMTTYLDGKQRQDFASFRYLLYPSKQHARPDHCSKLYRGNTPGTEQSNVITAYPQAGLHTYYFDQPAPTTHRETRRAAANYQQPFVSGTRPMETGPSRRCPNHGRVNSKQEHSMMTSSRKGISRCRQCPIQPSDDDSHK